MNLPPDCCETATDNEKGAPPQAEKRPLSNFAEHDFATIGEIRQARKRLTVDEHAAFQADCRCRLAGVDTVALAMMIADEVGRRGA